MRFIDLLQNKKNNVVGNWIQLAKKEDFKNVLFERSDRHGISILCFTRYCYDYLLPYIGVSGTYSMCISTLKDMSCGYYAEGKTHDDDWIIRKR